MIETQALIISGEDSKGIFVRSYRSADLMNKKIISENILSGKIYSDKSNEILIGNIIANKLNLKIGNKVKIAIPKTDKTIFGNIPRFKTLVVSGIFSVGMYEYDSNFIFTSPDISRKLLLLDDGTFTHIEIEINNLSKEKESQRIIDKHISKINPSLYSVTWMQNNSSLINALNVEKNVMFLILVLIILIASRAFLTLMTAP